MAAPGDVCETARQLSQFGVPAGSYANGVSHRSPGLFATSELPWVALPLATLTPKALHTESRDAQDV